MKLKPIKFCSNNMTSTIEDRLQQLETNEKTTAREIVRLKKENVELQIAVRELREEKSQNATKFKEMETQIKQIENNLREVYGFKDNAIVCPTHIESNTQQCVQDQLTYSMLAQVPLGTRKQMLGEQLFPLIRQMHEELAGKITGMLLEIDSVELMHLLESKESLRLRVDEAVGVLQAHLAKKE